MIFMRQNSHKWMYVTDLLIKAQHSAAQAFRGLLQSDLSTTHVIQDATDVLAGRITFVKFPPGPRHTHSRHILHITLHLMLPTFRLLDYMQNRHSFK